jgi:hypothetical protein
VCFWVLRLKFIFVFILFLWLFANLFTCLHIYIIFTFTRNLRAKLWRQTRPALPLSLQASHTWKKKWRPSM